MNNNRAPMRTARATIRNNRGLPNYNFLKLTEVVIRDILTDNKRKANSLKQELTLLSTDQLRTRKKNGKFYYSCFNTDLGKETSINNDIQRVHLLARRAYIEKEIAAIDRQIRLLSNVITDTQNAYYEAQLRKESARYADIGLDITRIIFTKEQNEWIDAPYTPNPYNVDSLKYETIGKLPVRSSSEREIGNMFEDIGLPYRSDDLVRIIRNDEHQGTPFRNTYFADFKVPNLLGGITVHEHLGAFHLENYSDNALQRLNDYHNFTVVELPGRPVGKNELTWSFESDLQGDENLKRLIARLLLPGIC